MPAGARAIEGDIEVTLNVEAFARYAAAMEALGTQKMRRVVSRALNKTGDRAWTKSKRSIARELNLKQRTVAAHMKRKRSYPKVGGKDQYEIIARGGRLPLKEYSPRQTRKGVTARIYGKRILHPHAFIIKSYGGNVYVRTSRKRFPIRKLFGPSIPVELLREPTNRVPGEMMRTVFPSEWRRLVDYELKAAKAIYNL